MEMNTIETLPPAPETAKARRARVKAEIAKSNADKKARLAKDKAKKAKATKGKKVTAKTVTKAPVTDKPVKVPKAPKLTKAEKAEAAVAGIEATDVKVKSNTAPAVELNTELQTAFDHFNKALFNSKLAPVMFSNVKLKKALGHFRPACWSRHKDVTGKLPEIGIDFTRLREQTKGDKEVLSTIVHEQAHQLQYMSGKVERGHGHMWCAIMRMVGLEPIILDTKGVPTGKATGPNSSHSIVEGGDFDKAADELLKSGFKFSWANEPLPEPEKKPSKKKKAGAKAKHNCPTCAANAWGKPSMILTCTGDKDNRHEPVEMECAREDYTEQGDDDGC